jgi:hypothetical protein
MEWGTGIVSILAVECGWWGCAAIGNRKQCYIFVYTGCTDGWQRCGLLLMFTEVLTVPDVRDKNKKMLWIHPIRNPRSFSIVGPVMNRSRTKV